MREEIVAQKETKKYVVEHAIAFLDRVRLFVVVQFARKNLPKQGNVEQITLVWTQCAVNAADEVWRLAI